MNHSGAMKSPSPRWLPISLLLFSLNCLAADEVPRDAKSEYLQRAALTGTPRCTEGEAIVLDVPLNAETEITYDASTGRLRVFYPMQFNDLTEGWNWHPEEVAAGRDYYTYKYLPLGSTHESRGSYRTTDLAGQPVEYPIRWRWDYFFAFDNPYAFYSRDAGETAGYAVEIALPIAEATRLTGGDLRMSLRGRLHANCLADSTTFWKATASAPVDFTLKKRYLIGQLEEVRFYDAASGQVLARLPASSGKSAR
jgi:hypothetical protein